MSLIICCFAGKRHNVIYKKRDEINVKYLLKVFRSFEFDEKAF